MKSQTLLQILSDGQFHSGEDLGKALGVSRAAIWKQIKKLDQKTVSIQSVRGKGYCLARSIELLDEVLIRKNIREALLTSNSSIHIFPEIDSSSEYLKRRYLQQNEQATHVCFAEFQSAGRGRRGRPWVSPFGANIYCSVYRLVHRAPGDLAGLSLALGVAVIRALNAVSVRGASLKWPNDIYLDGKKLGGVLIDLVGEIEGPSQIVAGIGLNILMPDNESKAIDQAWIDLSRYNGQFSRNQLAGELVTALLEVINQYEQQGFESFISEWETYDALSGELVTLSTSSAEIQGTACGIDKQGAIRLNTKGTITSYHIGEISLRKNT